MLPTMEQQEPGAKSPRIADRSRASPGDGADVPGEVAFYNIASDQARFYLDITESIQQRSIGLLGFAGILVGLVPLLIPLARQSESGFQQVASVVIALGVAALLISIWFATASILTKNVEYPRTSAVLKMFDEGRATSNEVYGNWSKTLLETTVPSFQEEAKARMQMFKTSVAFLAVGTSLLTIALVTLIIGVIK